MKKAIVLSFGILLVTMSLSAAPRYRKVFLSCENPGSHQDVAKTPLITNTTGKPIPSTTKVHWNASDGDFGYIQGPFSINESKSALGQAGNAYQCQAYYLVSY